MIIARKKVFDDLCKWLFPILFYVADKGGIEEDNYQNRYPGFISERLISYYFEKNRSNYKVVYSDKNFIKVPPHMVFDLSHICANLMYKDISLFFYKEGIWICH
jgi:hypothetical protein